MPRVDPPLVKVVERGSARLLAPTLLMMLAGLVSALLVFAAAHTASGRAGREAACDATAAEHDFFAGAAKASFGPLLGPRVGASCSETVTVYSMGSAAPKWERVGCPFARPGLVRWEERFPELQPEEEVVLMAGDNILLSCSPEVVLRRVTIEGGARLHC